MKLKILGLTVLVFFLAGLVFHRQLITHAKIIFFITEEFPQIPVKPLGLLTGNPWHQRIEIASKHGQVVADLFIPPGISLKPALIVAMGIKTADKDKPMLLKFADTMARLGFVVLWPRLAVLDQGISLPEEPETFIESFKYLESVKDVERISYVGFSVGSSIALVAAQDLQIRDKVHSLVFFGGYFDVFDYYASLATKTTKIDGQIIPWNPTPDAVDHAKGLLESGKVWQMLKIFEATSSAQAYGLLSQIPLDEKDRLSRFNPREKLADFKAKIFILHDKSDTYVPYTQSIRLNQVLTAKNKTFLLINLFEHVQPNRPINIGELVKLYGFLYKVFKTI